MIMAVAMSAQIASLIASEADSNPSSNLESTYGKRKRVYCYEEGWARGLFKSAEFPRTHGLTQNAESLRSRLFRFSASYVTTYVHCHGAFASQSSQEFEQLAPRLQCVDVALAVAAIDFFDGFDALF